MSSNMDKDLLIGMDFLMSKMKDINGGGTHNNSFILPLIIGFCLGCITVLLFMYIKNSDNNYNNKYIERFETPQKETKIIERYILPERYMHMNNKNFNQSYNQSNNIIQYDNTSYPILYNQYN